MLLSALSAVSAVPSPDDLPTVPFEAPKFGVRAAIPKAWPIAVRERDEYVFIAKVPQDGPDRPGAVACELGLAPESLEEYRTRIDGNARRGTRPGRLVRNEVVQGPKGERLESHWEFQPRAGARWHELSIRIVANRQMYTFILNVDDETFKSVRPAFEALVDSVEFSPPDTGADLVDKAANRWAQREFKFTLDLPEGWQPALAPDEVALLYATGPTHGIWADNALVIAHPHRPLDLKRLRRELPDQLRVVEPNCEVLSCEIVPQGKGQIEALETVVRTRRGPFSMTILERRFRGGRFDYEVKYTVETKRFDALAPTLRQSLDSFDELPGDVPAARPSRPA
ncbi:MAG: hypothetical protein IRY99_04565 [Isosphaeraceae bacterium]|nr:hypothetical protein [Isosphaeraceae bacterium]